ncbi:MAG: hypothetical protein GX875_04360, partial [Propionibacterium sp.]|nr:hypothetical protein [Propionibacterium sp.]
MNLPWASTTAWAAWAASDITWLAAAHITRLAAKTAWTTHHLIGEFSYLFTVHDDRATVQLA